MKFIPNKSQDFVIHYKIPREKFVTKFLNLFYKNGFKFTINSQLLKYLRKSGSYGVLFLFGRDLWFRPNLTGSIQT